MTTARRSRGPTGRRTVAAYVALTKPRIIELLLVTTVPVMFLAEGGVPSLWLVLATLVGGTLSAGAANTFNSVYDRDIDRLMHRTSNRPMVTGEITPAQRPRLRGRPHGRLDGLVRRSSSTCCRRPCRSRAIALYAVGYTMLLKRRTSQNIVWGGIAGCMPTLIGWSAVDRHGGVAGGHPLPRHLLLDPAALLAAVDGLQRRLLRRRRADAAASSRGPVAVGRQIVLYSWAMVGGVARAGAGRPDGLGLPRHRRRRRRAVPRRGAPAAARREGRRRGPALKPMRLFHFSITYVTVLFLAVAVDPLLHLAIG